MIGAIQPAFQEQHVKTGFAIRPLTPQDEPFLWEMVYQAIHVPEGMPPPPREILQAPGIAHYARRWGLRRGDLGFAAVDEAAGPPVGQPVGAAWLRLFTQRDPGYGYVDDQTPELSIALLPEYRGQGLGRLLIEALLDAAARQFPAVSLSVSCGNAAKRLYERLGFVVVAEDDSAQTMLKHLR